MNVWSVAILLSFVTLLRYLQHLLNHVSALIVNLLPWPDSSKRGQFSLSYHSTIDIFLVLLSVSPQQLFIFKTSICLSLLCFFSIFRIPQFPIFLNDLFILPCSPDFILNFLLLFRCLVQVVQYLLLSFFDLYEILLFAQIYNHLSPSLVPLTSWCFFCFRIFFNSQSTSVDCTQSSSSHRLFLWRNRLLFCQLSRGLIFWLFF